MCSEGSNEVTGAYSAPHVPFDDAENMNSPAPIVADNFEDDTSSDFGSEIADYTSLSSSILEYQYENGRRYHSNNTTVNYLMPNDEEEQDRMDLAHHIWLLLLKGELYKAPISNPQNILDLGTGTGIWAIDMAEQFPNARIVGNDISAIQPNWVPPNLEFIVEDYESDWLYKQNSFDFIHARLLAGCVADWPTLLRQIYDHLKPGAYFEIQESAVSAFCDDGTLKADSPLMEFLHAINTASAAAGREFDIYAKLKGWLIEAGFEDVTQFTYLLPYSPWPRDPYLKELGKYQAVMVQQAIESYGLRLFTQVLGWKSEHAKIFQALVKKQLRDKHMHAYVKEIVVYGRKPLK